ncbi:MAG TPA: hypothetical protein DCQ63_16465, partial [Planktothrix sp. UBA8402]|nr:hypothetical protein [Planktothrix sp. UBA8402]
MAEETSPLLAIGNEVVIFYRRGGVPPNPTVENGWKGVEDFKSASRVEYKVWQNKYNHYGQYIWAFVSDHDLWRI